MKMGIRFLSFVFAMVFFFGCVGMASADVIYTPEDDFYQSHQEQCQYEDRSYTTNGPNGTVTVYQSPESDKQIVTLDNGIALWISWTYEDSDGIVWGFWENYKTKEAGWIPMAYLEVIYDGRSFLEEYGKDIHQETGALDNQYAGETIRFWEYPGSEVCYETFFEDAYAPEYSAEYTDEAGRRWGRVHYYMSFSGWICLDDPTADHETLYPNVEPSTEPSVAETTQPEEPSEPVYEIKPKRTINVTFVVAAVAAVVAATVALLFLLKRKK